MCVAGTCPRAEGCLCICEDLEPRSWQLFCFQASVFQADFACSYHPAHRVTAAGLLASTALRLFCCCAVLCCVVLQCLMIWVCSTGRILALCWACTERWASWTANLTTSPHHRPQKLFQSGCCHNKHRCGCKITTPGALGSAGLCSYRQALLLKQALKLMHGSEHTLVKWTDAGMPLSCPAVRRAPRIPSSASLFAQTYTCGPTRRQRKGYVELIALFGSIPTRGTMITSTTSSTTAAHQHHVHSLVCWFWRGEGGVTDPLGDCPPPPCVPVVHGCILACLRPTYSYPYTLLCLTPAEGHHPA